MSSSTPGPGQRPITSTNQPSTQSTTEQPINAAGKRGARKVTMATPASAHSVKVARQGQLPQGQNVQGRKPAPTPAQTSNLTEPAAAAPGSPEAQLKEAEDKLTDVMGQMWMRDQLSIIQEIIKNPDLAGKLGINIKVQLPGSTTPVQVFPVIRGSGSPGPAHQRGYEQFLHIKSANLQARLNKEMPAKNLMHSYVVYRDKIHEIGEALENAKGEVFDWEPVYFKLLHQSFDQSISDGGTDFSFYRGDPDPSKAIDPQILAELEREGKTPPPKKKKKKDDEHLSKPQVEFRIKATPDDLHQHARMIHSAHQPPQQPHQSQT